PESALTIPAFWPTWLRRVPWCWARGLSIYCVPRMRRPTDDSCRTVLVAADDVLRGVVLDRHRVCGGARAVRYSPHAQPPGAGAIAGGGARGAIARRPAIARDGPRGRPPEFRKLRYIFT